MPPYILNRCMSQLPMKLSQPTPRPVSVGMPAGQLAPALHENEPPPFSSRLHELAVLHTPAGNTLKYLSIHDVSSMYEFCIAMGTACSQCTVMSLIRKV